MRTRFLVMASALVALLLISNHSFPATVPPNLVGTWTASAKPVGSTTAQKITLKITSQPNPFQFIGTLTVEANDPVPVEGFFYSDNTLYFYGQGSGGFVNLNNPFFRAKLDWLPTPMILTNHFMFTTQLTTFVYYHPFILKKSGS